MIAAATKDFKAHAIAAAEWPIASRWQRRGILLALVAQVAWWTHLVERTPVLVLAVLSIWVGAAAAVWALGSGDRADSGDQRSLDAAPTGSDPGFELALGVRMKTTLALRRDAEEPTFRRDRTMSTADHGYVGLRNWLPHYLRWHGVATRGRLGKRQSAARQP